MASPSSVIAFIAASCRIFSRVVRKVVYSTTFLWRASSALASESIPSLALFATSVSHLSASFWRAAMFAFCSAIAACQTAYIAINALPSSSK